MQNKERNLSLDIMKTILVLGMISAHVFQFCYKYSEPIFLIFL